MQDAASERQGEEGVQRCSEVEAGHGVRQGQHRTRDETKRPVRLDAGPRSERTFRCQARVRSFDTETGGDTRGDSTRIALTRT